MVSHDQVQRDDIVERYARGTLDADTRLAFEEHYFTCDVCFADVLRMEEIVAGVRAIAERGALGTAPEGGAAGPTSPASVWRRPVVFLPMAAALIAAVGAGWMAVHEARQLDKERAHAASIAGDQRAAAAALDAERQQRTGLEQQIARLAAPEADVPLAVLQNNRGPEGVTRLSLPAGATRFVLWAAVGQDAAVDAYRLTVIAPGGRSIASVDGLHRTDTGAIVASVPAAGVPRGRLLVRIEGLRGGAGTLLSESVLEIR